MADLDRTQAVYDVQTLEDALADSVAPRRFTAFLLNERQELSHAEATHP